MLGLATSSKEQASALEFWLVLGLEALLIASLVLLFARVFVVYRAYKAGKLDLPDNSRKKAKRSANKAEGLAPVKTSRAARNSAIEARLARPAQTDCGAKQIDKTRIEKQASENLASKLALGDMRAHSATPTKASSMLQTAATANTTPSQTKPAAKPSNKAPQYSKSQAIVDDYIGDFFS